MAITTDQTTLQNFLKRRHPEYEGSLGHWNFLEATYHGGRAWFDENIFRYIKEGDKEYGDRVNRSYRFNHTRELVDLVQKYVFKSTIVRNVDDAPSEITAFWDKTSYSGLDVSQFMRLVSTMSSIYGRVWVFVDSNKSSDVVTKADEASSGTRVYAYIVKPQDVLDIGFTDDGDINWIFVREIRRDDADPISASGEVKEVFRLWTREDWYLFDEIDAGNRGKVVRVIDGGINEIKRVPCFPVDHVIGEHRYTAPGLINDIAYLDRAVANYLSNLDAIIQDQTFSQLVMPAQGLLPGDDKYDKLLEMGTKRIFAYDGEAGATPEYISPDAKQAELIITVINKIISEIYHTVGLAGERTQTDNAIGTDNSSGVAKAYDFERVNSLLAAKADALENAENNIVELVLAYHGKPAPEKELVKYPDTFDVRSLFDEFTIAEKLLAVKAPDMVRREQMNQVIEKLFPRLSSDLREKMTADLKSWPPKEVVAAPGQGATSSGAANRNPQTASRQGQVTSSTPKGSSD